MHLLALPPLWSQVVSQKATSRLCGPRAAKPLQPFGRAEIEVPRPPLRRAAALGPNPRYADTQGVDAGPRDLHFNH